MGAIKNGLEYAKNGKNASQAIKDKYLIPWDTKEKAITGGAIFIGSSYINIGQKTLYLQKFDVASNNNQGLFWHQYMTNVLAPYSEASSIYKGYSSMGLLDTPMTFIIPVYNNMPESLCESPNIIETDFEQDNSKVYADVQTTLNIRTGPNTSYESLIKVDRNVVMTRIAKGKQAGELWDKVLLPNGMVGYAFQSYLKELPNIQIENITLSVENTKMKKGESQKLNVTVTPPEAKDYKLEYSSSEPNIVSIDNEGNILALKSGKATITVKSLQNNVTGQIEIEVYTPLIDMQINTENLVMQEGDTYFVTPIFIPKDADNKNIKYTSKKEEIASVDPLGNIIANKQGSTEVVVQTEEGNITKEIKVTVVEKLKEGEIIFDESLRVEQNLISRWNAENINIKEIKSKIKTSYTMKIYDYDGNELTQESDKVGTGGKITFFDENNNIKAEYYIILYGDVNGDGKINSIDLLKVQRHILEIEGLNGFFLKAGNINKNGKSPSSLDLLLIQRHILALKAIEQ